MNDSGLTDNCFENAAVRLPEGWSIEITLEKGYGGLVLTDESGDVIECDKFDSEPFPAYVRRAVTIAENINRRERAK